MINARLRKRFLQGGFGVGLIGQPVDLTYPYDYLGAGTETLSAVAEGNGAFADVLERSQRPMVILGMGALARPDGAAVLARLEEHTSELQSLMRTSYAVFCLKKN